MTKILESTIHKELKAIIELDDLGNKITGRSEVDAAIDSLSNHDFIPSFSLDYLARKKLLKSAEYILPKINGLDLISSDKSISKEKGDVLRPDFVTYNPEEKCFVVIELKKDKQTAREAMTELLAYEQEIQNHMPFCSNLDVLFIIISPEWSTLLDHSIASAVTWSSHKILALNYDISSKALSVHVPDVWSRMSIPLLPKNSGSTITLFCNGLSDHNPVQALYNALDLIKEFGDRENLSGFCYLWRDWHPLSDTKWNITVCIINPVEIYKSSCFLDFNQRDNPLSTYIANNISDMENYYPSSMFSMIKKGKEYLSKFCDPQYGDLRSWYMDLELNRFRSMPSEFRFFGEFSDFTQDLIGNDGFWLMNLDSLKNSQQGFTNPMLAVPFIDSIFGKEYLENGVINLYECAKIGKLISIMEMALSNYLGAHEEPMEKRAYFLCIYRWYQFNLISLVYEIKFLLQSVSNTKIESLTLKTSDDQDALDSIAEFKLWLINDLIGSGNYGHQLMLSLASTIGYLKDKTFKDIVSEVDRVNVLLSQKETIMELSADLSELRDTYVSDKEVEEAEKLRSKIKQILNENIDQGDSHELVDSVIEEMPKFLDLIMPPVHFEVVGIDLSKLDWEEIRKSYTHHFESGRNDVCVCLRANGEVEISQHEMAHLMSKNINPDEKFLFLDENHGLGMIRSIGWFSVDDGSFFYELRDIESKTKDCHK